MAFSKKNKRKITIDGNDFYWIYKQAAEILRLTVMTDEKTHSRLVCEFKQKNPWLYWQDSIIPLKISPEFIRQIIDMGITEGWKPFTKGKDFILKDIEKKIDINFWTETTAEERKSKI